MHSKLAEGQTVAFVLHVFLYFTFFDKYFYN